MPQYVYACQKCKFELRHILDKSFGPVYSFACPKCQACNKFQFVREVNLMKEIFDREVAIKNRRRRDGDGLYKSDRREKKPGSESKDDTVKKA